jgi:lipoprotein-anchoring transpeptidase ErfK/SrfK
MRRLLVVGLTATALILTACGGDDSSSGDDSGSDAAPSEDETATSEPAAPPTLTAFDGDVAYDEPVTLQVNDGTIKSADVAADEGDALSGSVVDGAWVSDDPPEPGLTYHASVVAIDGDDAEHDLETSFSVAGVPDGNRLTLSMQPSKESVVGVGAPIVIRFDQAVTEKAALEEHMIVASSTPVVGAWNWISDTEAHFRPEEYWPAGTDVALDLDFNGVKAGEDLWGGRSYQLDFSIGKEQITKVDADAKRMAYIVNGTTEATWETSLGAEDFATRNGTYVVLSKERTRNMTSCNANITCEEGDDDYYDLDVDFSVRLTWSGTFVHAAPWSEGAQGNENVSHGCLNLSEKDGEFFYNQAQYGDVVTVVNSSRGPGDLVSRGDPGMVDWNQSWDDYVAGSALGAEVTTEQL